MTKVEKWHHCTIHLLTVKPDRHSFNTWADSDFAMDLQLPDQVSLANMLQTFRPTAFRQLHQTIFFSLRGQPHADITTSLARPI